MSAWDCIHTENKAVVSSFYFLATCPAPCTVWGTLVDLLSTVYTATNGPHWLPFRSWPIGTLSDTVPRADWYDLPAKWLSSSPRVRLHLISSFPSPRSSHGPIRCSAFRPPGKRKIVDTLYVLEGSWRVDVVFVGYMLYHWQVPFLLDYLIEFSSVYKLRQRKDTKHCQVTYNQCGERAIHLSFDLESCKTRKVEISGQIFLMI